MKRELATHVEDLPHQFEPAAVEFAHADKVRCAVCSRDEHDELHGGRELALEQAPAHGSLITEKGV